MAAYSPPFTLTHAMLSRVAEIAELVGQWRSVQRSQVPMLRRENRIRTIQASLAIEHNTLSVEQVTAVIEGKTVLGLPREILEVRNAFAAYEAMPDWGPASAEDLLGAHGLLMCGLCDDAGHWRSSGVGIYRGEQLVHMAPPANQVPRLMEQLLTWLAETEAHPLIASCALHYELEFIHPFADGNGRMGRLWQTVILSRWQPVMAFLPVETVIKSRQELYYQQLSQADKLCDCTGFILFLLEALRDALTQAIITQPASQEQMRVKNPVEMRVKTPEQILAVLAADPTLTLKQVAEQIGKSTSTVERAVARLSNAGRLRFVGPRKGGRWEVLPINDSSVVS
ncbi:Fic family protein [Aeromonas hydrophila]|uniref:Fic family protein n=1 Tax=Aeromonas hydrophila TaxID=644 RepID=UPI000640AFCB|nr:Fic family protein [Aeromonas hydrophila]HDK8694915.1 Fic family protein [Aeromonas hydrophila]